MALFDPKRHKLHLERSQSLFENHRFLYDDLAAELIDRLQDIKRNFHNILDLSTYPLPLSRLKGCIKHCPPPFKVPVTQDEACYDLVISNLALHWVEDIPGLLNHIRRSLKPDGLFLANFFGGDTLHELRTSLMEAELQLTGGASLRTAPMTRIQDAPMLLGRAGFALPVVDSERLTITYPFLKRLVEDLRGMGETLKTNERNPFSRRLFQEAEEVYRRKFGREDGTLPVTVDVITLTGWSPSESQPVPLKRGSAKASLRDALS